MKLFRKKGSPKRLDKGLVALILLSLFNFNIPQARSAEDAYAIPANWPSNWVAPFANEEESSSVNVANFPEMNDKKPRFTKYVVATAYSSDIRQTDAYPFRPAMNMDFREEVAKNGMVNCIAHNDLRLGTKVRFPDMHGDTIYTVCDRMNVRYTGKNRVDFYFYVVGENGSIDSTESLNLARANAKAFGVKKAVKMEVF